ncbi:MAG: type II secretion system protein N [Deltaproteobacteria bacterium]
MSRIKNFIYTSAQKHLNFRYILAAAYFFMGVSFIYLAASLIYPLVGLKRIKLPAVSNYNAKEFPEIAQAQEPKPLEFYLEGLSNKRIFANQGFPDINAAASAQGLALTKDVNLIGIISGDSPQAIIEDKREQKTYYLTKGQFFGEMMVEDIQADRIIINYKGSRFELYL